MTHEPVSDAAVVVLWRKMSMRGYHAHGIYRVQETVTRSDGSFSMARWGPRPVDYDDYLDSRDPEVWILRRGYLVGYFDENGAVDPRPYVQGDRAGIPMSKDALDDFRSLGARHMRSAVARPRWNGKQLALYRAASPDQEARSLAIAAPLEQYDPIPPPLPIFWREWHQARAALGGDWSSRIEQPLPPSAR